MVVDNEQVGRKRIERIRLGELATNGLKSDFWLEIIKPILDSMLKGIRDIDDINLSSEKKASIELAGRKLASKYISEIQTLIEGYIIDSEAVKKILENQERSKPLYKNIE